jgi:hypothetical protein
MSKTNEYIRVVSSEDLANSPLAKKTAPEIWTKRGFTFFEQDNFGQGFIYILTGLARKCFINGASHLKVRECDARILLQKSDILNAKGKQSSSLVLILESALIFRDELCNNKVRIFLLNKRLQVLCSLKHKGS